MERAVFAAILPSCPPAAAERAVSDWHDLPAAVALHPVEEHLLLRWQRATADAMAGPGASPLFRDVASEMEVHWRLVAAGWDTLAWTEEDEWAVLSLAVTGTSMGFETVVRQTLDRSEELATIQRIARSATGPQVDVRDTPDGVAVHVEEAPYFPRAAVARIGEPASRSRRRPPAPGIAIGTGLRLVQPGGPDELSTEDDAPERPVPGAAAWMQMDEMVVDVLRIEAQGGLDEAPEKPRDQPFARWLVIGRQELVPRVNLHSYATSDPDTFLPQRVSGGIGWLLPVPGAWYTRSSLIRKLPTASAAGEWKMEVGVRTTLGWRVPQDPDRWPLGQEPDAPGPWLPSQPEDGPNEVRPVCVPSVARVVDPPEGRVARWERMEGVPPVVP